MRLGYDRQIEFAKADGRNFTYVSPCITRAMDLVSRSENVRGIAKIREPHVFNVGVIECLELER
jgi:hypothetical protein